MQRSSSTPFSLAGKTAAITGGASGIGLEIARRLYEAMALKTHSPWNQRCLISSETGLPVWGDDYYSNLVIWALPMALAGESVAQFVRPAGLVDRMIQAGAEIRDAGLKIQDAQSHENGS